MRAIGAPNCKPGTGVAEFKKPMGISFDKSGNMFVADTENNRVQCLKKSGQFSHIIGAGKQGSGKGELNNPTDTAVDSQGRETVGFVVVFSSLLRILKFSKCWLYDF